MATEQKFDPSPLTWAGSDRMLARRVARPLNRFLHIEAAGGIVLLVATVAALVWANSPWKDLYHEILETHIVMNLGGLHVLDEPIEAWINDALMAIFFFVMGLEIKRELVTGELRDPRAATLPAVAAMGGVIVPALVYFAFNPSGPASAGWGIPMATDIAFTLGVVSLLGTRVPTTIKIFLLTLAIVDDIAAILVIAVFYTDDLSVEWLLVTAAGIVAFLVLRLTGVWYTPAYVVAGAFIWLAMFESGIHATLAGVIVGIMTPARPLIDNPRVGEGAILRVLLQLRQQERKAGPREEGPAARRARQELTAPVMHRAYFELKEQVSVAERLNYTLHPWSSFVIIPIFALANAGVEISFDSLSEAARSPVTHGVLLGLVAGKLVGISLFTWAGVRLGLFRLPGGATWAHVFGLGALAGIGFTVSLFITGLEFAGELADQAKMGVLAASAIAAVIGALIFLRAGPGPRSHEPGEGLMDIEPEPAGIGSDAGQEDLE